MSTHKSIFKSASIIGLATFCSRILGFIRDVVIARLFGVEVYAQAFVVAFRIPNLFRDLVGEGAANAAFVPVFSEYTAKHTKEEFWEMANVVLSLILVILSVITILGVIFSPLIVRLIAPGFLSDPYKLEATIRLNRIIFPYILLVGLAAYAMAILNSLRHFSVPAFAPCLLNVSIIIFAIMFGEGIKGLALGILVGGLLQLGIQLPVLFQKGLRLDLFRRFRHPAAATIGKLMLPRVLSSCIYQLNNFVDSIFGSLALIVGEGGVAILYFSYRMIQFPLGIFSNSLVQALLPTLSLQALEENRERLKATLSFGLRATFFVLLPSSVGFMVLAQPVIRNLFEGGRFGADATATTANVLLCYSIGLFAYGASKVLQSGFFALKDTVTPTKVSALALGCNIILNTLLMFPLKLSGLALSTSISGVITFFFLTRQLKRKLLNFDFRPIFFAFLKILAASLCMGLVCYLVAEKNVSFGSGIFARVTALGLPLVAGLISYIAFCFIFQVSEIKELWKWLIKRKASA
jgi:putative peptidoglycan lipid II flippase